MAEVHESAGDTATQKVVDNNENKQKEGRKKKRGKGKSMRDKRPRVEYQPFIKDNENLRKFYKEQPLFNNEEEYDEFIKGLHETLPASFRINTFDYGQALFLRRLVEKEEFKDFLEPEETPDKPEQIEKPSQVDEHKNGEELPPVPEGEGLNEADGVVEEDEKVDGTAEPTIAGPQIEPLVWYPNNFAWRMNITRLDLRKSPVLQRLHKFIMAETDNGFISRQEAVSMIPPLVLDVRRGHNVLDMCAAPGSKTAQLLEYLKNDIMDSTVKGEYSANGVFDDGMVVANDLDNKRCYMLVHQSNRLNSPNCIIINDDASRLPNMKTFNKDGESFTDLKFDRILCDVPCSGDGTIRKNPDVWKKWSVGNTNNFHGMQLKILKRGIELLKKDGLLVYSTCSMSPIEDEAVIASLLRACEGSVKLEDFVQRLPGLKFKPGTSKWTMMNRDMEIVPSYEQIPKENTTQIFPSQFPPTEEEAEKFELSKCARVLPHLQNTGGFFVALLKKITDNLPWEKQSQVDNSKLQCDPKPKPAPINPKKRHYTGFREDPFFFVDENDPDWIGIRDVYGLNSDFPFNQLVYRCSEGKKRSIYLVAKRIRNFIIANREENDRPNFVKLINGGMRLFSRADTEAGFRICQDGVNEVLPYIKQDFKVPITKEDLVSLLKTRAVPFNSLSSCEHILNRIKQGSFILIYNYEIEVGETQTQSYSMPLVAWKGEKTISLYVSNTYRVHLCAIAQIKTELCKSL